MMKPKQRLPTMIEVMGETAVMPSAAGIRGCRGRQQWPVLRCPSRPIRDVVYVGSVLFWAPLENMIRSSEKRHRAFPNDGQPERQSPIPIGPPLLGTEVCLLCQAKDVHA